MVKGNIQMTDEYFMQEALKEAQKAYRKGESPVGAVVVMDGKIIARGYNQRESKQDPTAHAEIIAIRKAAHKLGNWRLNGCDLYVTLEPCPMCAGAAIQARIDKIVIGTMDPKAGALGSKLNLLEFKFNHEIDIKTGILEKECADVLKRFFKELRE